MCSSAAAEDGETGLEIAREWQPDLILLDVDMPDRDGFVVSADLKAEPVTMDIPIIFLTAFTSQEDKIRGLDLGATDYITKPFDPAELRARVRATLRTRRLVELLSKKAMIDGLTGLWNRTYLEMQLSREHSAARRSGNPLSCVMADVDRFKQLNDTCGHGFGDDVLRIVAKILTNNSRGEDIVCRYGGEEFTILLPNTSAETAAALSERLRMCHRAAGLHASRRDGRHHLQLWRVAVARAGAAYAGRAGRLGGSIAPSTVDATAWRSPATNSARLRPPPTDAAPSTDGGCLPATLFHQRRCLPATLFTGDAVYRRRCLPATLSRLARLHLDVGDRGVGDHHQVAGLAGPPDLRRFPARLFFSCLVRPSPTSPWRWPCWRRPRGRACTTFRGRRA